MSYKLTITNGQKAPIFERPIAESDLNRITKLINKLSLLDRVRSLGAGECILIDRAEQNTLYRQTKRLGVTVVMRKISGKGIGVWRTDLLLEKGKA